jgi:hypothetical protein
VSKIATVTSVLRGQNRVFRLILAKQKGRLRAARLFRLSRSLKRRWFSRSCVEGLWLRADDLVFVLAFNRPGSDLLSRVLRRSTMGAGAFHGRVRNGNGCSHPAITTRSTKGKNCAGDSAKPNEKLARETLFYLLNTSFQSVLGTSGACSARPRAVAPDGAARPERSDRRSRQCQDKTKLLGIIEAP